jgi:alkanesulfonate monooxygenase SsuD/methylene tetrahydromethanopterin reductase-like flavin-dependent oxidoreductase (luciferase family)
VILTGRLITYRGRHYTVDTARLYSVPEVPPPVFMSGFGEKAVRLAAEIADDQAPAVAHRRHPGGVGSTAPAAPALRPARPGSYPRT